MNPEIEKRRTFAIVSHPDAGKTTITEKFLWYGNVIREAGHVRAKANKSYTVSDWMKIEQQRGISVSSSVLNFPFEGCMFNLVDTPGHQDFCEDTYRALTAVDAALVLIDSVNGVEKQTIRLMNVCRMRHTPIITFINKMDLDGRHVLDLLDQIESVLQIKTAPFTLPIGVGKLFKGVYAIAENTFHTFNPDDRMMASKKLSRWKARTIRVSLNSAVKTGSRNSAKSMKWSQAVWIRSTTKSSSRAKCARCSSVLP